MSTIDYPRFTRALNRCEEVAKEEGMKATVVLVYKDVLMPVAKVYLAADSAVTKAESSFATENKDALDALDALDGLYREARSTVAAFVPGIVLPDPLKTQRTDTDKVDGIKDLVGVLADNAGKNWADLLSSGEFGTKAPKTIKDIQDAIGANKGLTAARTARSSSYQPAYDAYIRFKRVVRDGLGTSSPQYRRIHFRDANVKDDVKDSGKLDGKSDAPANGSSKSDAPVNGASPPDVPGKGTSTP